MDTVSRSDEKLFGDSLAHGGPEDKSVLSNILPLLLFFLFLFSLLSSILSSVSSFNSCQNCIGLQVWPLKVRPLFCSHCKLTCSCSKGWQAVSQILSVSFFSLLLCTQSSTLYSAPPIWTSRSMFWVLESRLQLERVESSLPLLLHLLRHPPLLLLFLSALRFLPNTCNSFQWNVAVVWRLCPFSSFFFQFTFEQS